MMDMSMLLSAIILFFLCEAVAASHSSHKLGRTGALAARPQGDRTISARAR